MYSGRLQGSYGLLLVDCMVSWDCIDPTGMAVSFQDYNAVKAVHV